MFSARSVVSSALAATLLLATACGGPPAPTQTPEQSNASVASKESEYSVAVSGEGTNRYPTAPAATTRVQATGKFDQTWTTGYGQTTCSQWFSVMTGHETFVAAADMLVNARATVDKNAALPSDNLINSFKAEIDQACQPIPTMTITDAAAGVYLLSDGRYAP